LRLGLDVILTDLARHLFDQVTLVAGSTPLTILALRSIESWTETDFLGAATPSMISAF
jgi:hypothetical protein